MAGRTSLANLPRLLKNCALYVGNDSGPKHVAAAVGIPTIGIHSGVVDPIEWGPIGPTAVALRRNMTCSPCYLAKAEDCPRALACLKFFEPALVYEAADLLLQGGAAGRKRRATAEPGMMEDARLLELAAGLASLAAAEILAIRDRGFQVERKAGPVRGDGGGSCGGGDHSRRSARGGALPGCSIVAEEEVAGGQDHRVRRRCSGWSIRWTGRMSSPMAAMISRSISGLVRDGRPALGVVGRPGDGGAVRRDRRGWVPGGRRTGSGQRSG